MPLGEAETLHHESIVGNDEPKRNSGFLTNGLAIHTQVLRPIIVFQYVEKRGRFYFAIGQTMKFSRIVERGSLVALPDIAGRAILGADIDEC